ncbi:MAG: hypothetical protein P0Y52_12615 [Candidatus Brevundimonas phytovorans]|nr:hypothetical protein [Brevundimonas sp.]WEK57375.1 MAG: hypothetical protein P0Y52_12615 [Brevundimonas sp.]
MTSASASKWLDGLKGVFRKKSALASTVAALDAASVNPIDVDRLLAAANACDLPALRVLDDYISHCTARDAPKMRALLNPLGRAGYSELQVRVWAKLLAIDPSAHANLDRALRLVVATLSSEGQNARITSQSTRAAIETILDMSSPETRLQEASWHTSLIQATSGFDPTARSARSVRLVQALAPVLTARFILRLQAGWPQLNARWIWTFYTEMKRIARLREAEILIRALSEANPDQGRYFFRVVDNKVRRRLFAEALVDLGSPQGAYLTVQEIARALNRIPDSVVIDRAAFKDLEVAHALRLFFATALDHRHRALGLVVTRYLKTISPADLAWNAMEIYLDEGARSLQVEWDLALLRLNRVHRALGRAMAKWAATSTDHAQRALAAETLLRHLEKNSAEGGPALVALRKRVSLWGVYTVEDLEAINPPIRSAAAEKAISKTQVVLTLAELDAAVAGRFGEKGIDYEELRVGLASKGEKDTGAPQTVGDVGFTVNSAGDYASATLAIEISKAMTQGLFGRAPKSGSFEAEVVRLLMEDRIFPSISQSMKLYEYLKSRNIAQVTVVVDDVHYINAMQIAFFLKSMGFKNVLVLFNVRKAAALSALRGAWSGEAIKIEQITLNLASLALKNVEPRTLKMAEWLPALSSAGPESEKVGQGKERKRVLILTSLGDSSYFTSSVALYKRLASFLEVRVYNGAASGDEKFAEVTRIQHDHLTPRLLPDVALKAAMRAPMRRMFEAFRANWTGSQADIFFLCNASRFVNSIPLGLAHEIAQVQALRNLLVAEEIDLVVTMPGRMVSARSTTMVARKLGIPTLDLQAFFISPHPRYHASMADIYGGLTEDQLAVYAAKAPPKRQAIKRIGSLMIGEQLGRVKDMTIQQARAQLDIVTGRPVIVFGAQHGQGAEGDEIIRMIVRAANTVADSLLIVKLHPRTPLDAVEGLRAMVEAEATGEVKVQREGDIYALMKAADLVVTQFSNVGLEAAMMGRAVLSINLTGADYVVDLARLGVAMRATSDEEVVAKVHALLSDEESRAELHASREAYFNKNPELRDLTAGETVEDIIRATLKMEARPRAADRLANPT